MYDQNDSNDDDGDDDDGDDDDDDDDKNFGAKSSLNTWRKATRKCVYQDQLWRAAMGKILSVVMGPPILEMALNIFRVGVSIRIRLYWA